MFCGCTPAQDCALTHFRLQITVDFGPHFAQIVTLRCSDFHKKSTILHLGCTLVLSIVHCVSQLYKRCYPTGLKTCDLVVQERQNPIFCKRNLIQTTFFFVSNPHFFFRMIFQENWARTRPPSLVKSASISIAPALPSPARRGSREVSCRFVADFVFPLDMLYI